MRAGELRNRVTIQSKQVVQNSFGEEVITWIDVATVWAAVEPLLGREYLEGRQIQADLSTRIRMRHRSGIRPEMRAVHGAAVYDILSVQHVRTEHQELVLMCREQL